MRITYSIPKKALKKKKDALRADIAGCLPNTACFIDEKRGLLSVDTLPDADPIEIAEKLRLCFAALEITATRVTNESGANGFVNMGQAPAIQFLAGVSGFRP